MTNDKWENITSMKNKRAIPKGGSVVFHIISDDKNTKRWELRKDKPFHMTFNLFDKEGLLYLIWADRSLIDYNLSLNYKSNAEVSGAEMYDKGQIENAELHYNSKGNISDEFGQDTIDMIVKVGKAMENLEKTHTKGGLLAFNFTPRLSTIMHRTNMMDMVKKYKNDLHLRSDPENDSGIGDR